MDRLPGNAFVYGAGMARLGQGEPYPSVVPELPWRSRNRGRSKQSRTGHLTRAIVAIVAIIFHGAAVLALMLDRPPPKRDAVPAMVMVDLSRDSAKPAVSSAPVRLLQQIQPQSINVPQPVSILMIATQEPAVVAAPSVSPPGSARAAPSLKMEWAARVLRHLELYKHYPREAAAQHAEGVAYLRFSIDRSGTVLHAYLDKSSGYDLLDGAALALVRKASPLPSPPSELEGDIFELEIPITFSL